jgi:hypothetical protein
MRRQAEMTRMVKSMVLVLAFDWTCIRAISDCMMSYTRLLSSVPLAFTALLLFAGCRRCNTASMSSYAVSRQGPTAGTSLHPVTPALLSDCPNRRHISGPCYSFSLLSLCCPWKTKKRIRKSGCNLVIVKDLVPSLCTRSLYPVKPWKNKPFFSQSEFSLSSHRHSYIPLIFGSRFIVS